VDLGALPALYAFMGILYMLGGLVFGIATFRAGILPRWAAGLLAVTAVVTPAAALLPHHLQRLAGMPVGIAVAWLGFALLTERRARGGARPRCGQPPAAPDRGQLRAPGSARCGQAAPGAACPAHHRR
jgi:hypothetical protein